MYRLFPCTWLLAALLASAMTGSAQVTIVSPEEGRRALKNLPPSVSKPATSGPATAQPAQPRRGSLLPDEFAGWQGSKAQSFGPYSAATLAGEDAPVLVEYGFAGAERKLFQKGSSTLTIDALRFKDGSGSYGLYTYLRGADWQTRDLGKEQVAVRDGQVLVRKGEILVRASLAGGSVASSGSFRSPIPATDLDALIGKLESTDSGPLPTIAYYLPEEGLNRRSRKYILGPIAFSRAARNLPAALVDFQLSAEVALAQYQLAGREVTLLLLSYPTPQHASQKLRQWETPAPVTTSDSSRDQLIYARRSGPLLAFVIGASDQSAADQLLNRIVYQAEVTWSQPVEKMNVPTFAQFILNVFLLIGLLVLFALIAGLGFGILRIAVKARYPNRLFDRPEETEIIRLNINY